jgi:integrase
MQVNFKPARLHTGKRWFVSYYYLEPRGIEYKRFKEYFDINRMKDLKKRKIYGEELAEFLNEKLAAGFNPFKATSKTKNQKCIYEQLTDLVADLKGSATQKETYTCMMNRFLKFISCESLNEICITQVDIDVANRFKTWMEQIPLSKKTINSSLAHLGLFWKAAIREKLVSGNPFASVERVKRSATDDESDDVFEPLNFDELQVITAHLENKQQHNFIRFLNMIYCAWARPVEICRLTVGDIDLRRDYIRFRKPGTKSKKGAMVQIIPQLKTLLAEMKLENYPKDFYLFTKNNYMPGDEMMDSEIPMNRWKKEVQQHLGIKKKMYALKHTGNIEYLLQNKETANLKWQQMQNRHSSNAMTERYIRKLGAYFIEIANINFKRL